MSLFTFEQRFDMVCTAAWEKWTNNGSGMDTDELEQTMKSVRDAATNVYNEDMDLIDWIDATVASLNK